MARKSLEELEQVSANDLLEVLQQENAQLRMDLAVHKIVLAKLRDYISNELAESFDN